MLPLPLTLNETPKAKQFNTSNNRKVQMHVR